MKKLTQARVRALETAAWGTEHFGAVVTGWKTRLRDVLVLVELGLMESAGDVVVCDGDGFALVPERYRPGWRLTPAGRQWLKDTERLKEMEVRSESRRKRAKEIEKELGLADDPT